MEIKTLLRIISRRKWVAIQAFLIIFLTAVVGSHFLIPIYETSAKLLFRPPAVQSSVLAGIGMEEIAGFLPSRQQEVDIGTKVTLTQVNPLLEKVISRLQVRDRQGELLSPEKLLSRSVLSGIFPTPFISIKRDPDSNTATITARSPDPYETMFLANTLAEVYIEDSENEKKRETRSASLFIEDQITKVKQEYNQGLKELRTFYENTQSVDLEIEAKVAVEKMAELMKEKEDNIIDISEVEAKIRTLKGQLKEQASESIPVSFMKDNPHIQKIKANLSELRLRLADLLTDETEEHPDVIAVKKQIGELERELEKEIEDQQYYSPELNGLKRQLAALRVHLDGVNRDIGKYAALFRTLPEKNEEAAKLKRSLIASKDIYSSLLDYRNRIGVAEAMTLSDVRLVQPATRPYEPVGPNKVLNGLMGGFLGLIFAFGLALLFEYADDTIKSPEELEEHKELAFLGCVPQIGKPKLIAELDANDPVSETYRTIRHSIKFASIDRSVRSLLATSGRPGEGKSTTVANLGISFSQAGVNTLLIDTDLRRPSLHKIFDRPNEIGLINVIGGECNVDEAIVETGIDGLSLLPSGPTPLDPGRVLESEKLKEVISILTNRYELVILDSAPVLIKSDATVLGHYVDGVIQVLEAGKTNKGALAETVEVFRKANIRPVGVILNRYEERKTYPVKAPRRRKMRIGGWRREV